MHVYRGKQHANHTEMSAARNTYVYLDPHDLIGPSLASGETLNNLAEKRKRMIARALRTSGSRNCTWRTVDRPLPLTLEATAGVQEEGILRLFTEGWAAWTETIKTRPGFTKDHGLRVAPVTVGGPDGEEAEKVMPDATFYMVAAQIAPKGVVTRPGNTVMGWITKYAQVGASVA